MLNYYNFDTLGCSCGPVFPDMCVGLKQDIDAQLNPQNQEVVALVTCNLRDYRSAAAAPRETVL